MTKRKRDPTKDAVVTLLTHPLDNIASDLIDQIELKLRSERSKRSQGIASVIGNPTTTSDSTEISRVFESTALSTDPLSKSVSEPSEPILQFLYDLRFSILDLEEFFSCDPSSLATQLRTRADIRVEVLQKYSKPGELSLQQRFQRFLADRSFALAYENYGGGRCPFPDFVASIRLEHEEDKKLVRDSYYRGKLWRALEASVGEIGISAVVSCQHTKFKKLVGMKGIGLFTEYLEWPAFDSIKTLARGATTFLNTAQSEFNNLIEIGNMAPTTLTGSIDGRAGETSGISTQISQQSILRTQAIENEQLQRTSTLVSRRAWSFANDKKASRTQSSIMINRTAAVRAKIRTLCSIENPWYGPRLKDRLRSIALPPSRQH